MNERGHMKQQVSDIDAQSYNYIARQLRLAIDDAPGGEKAWVPIRRSLAIAILGHLEQAEFTAAQYVPARTMLDSLVAALKPLIAAAEPELIELSTTPEPEADNESLRPLDIHGTVESETPQMAWASLTRDERVALIRNAHKFGVRYACMPDKRTWRRHYPEAFATCLAQEVNR